MGLKLTLPADKNPMYHEFVDAYWAISDPNYSMEEIAFVLEAYPSRDAKLLNGKPMESSSIGFGSGGDIYSTRLYVWIVRQRITSIFPNGIPLDKDVQKTTIYNWIKAYTRLPFQDVFEH